MDDSEVIHDPAPMKLRRVAAILAVASLAALTLNPWALVDWAFELPLALGPARILLIDAATVWAEAADAIGLTAFHDGLRSLFGLLQSA
ncbi:hypothetical protein [Inquilinus sp. CAU 1745]|uniref:hypothetical protein n=1 Tax=Inquilinus sp. CAU 1745 TaxID=3140369 RepID=UPI00325B2123